jgi:hypothetical protein
MVPPSVVVHDLNLLRLAILPDETDSILIVDTDAVLPPPITGESLKVIPGKRAQVVESLGCVKLRELALRDPGDAPKPARRISLKERLCVAVPEGPDHLRRLLRIP